MAELTVPIVVDWEGIKSYMEKHDIVEVVRCKDCKYATGWTTKNGLYGGLTCESLVDMDVDEDFFCAFGEMKENDSVK